jgi:transcription elongation factor Elf1
MKCPKCGYEDEVKGNLEGLHQGEHGDFYTCGMTRESNRLWDNRTDVIQLFACPVCSHLFISNEVY